MLRRLALLAALGALALSCLAQAQDAKQDDARPLNGPVEKLLAAFYRLEYDPAEDPLLPADKTVDGVGPATSGEAERRSVEAVTTPPSAPPPDYEIAPPPGSELLSFPPPEASFYDYVAAPPPTEGDDTTSPPSPITPPAQPPNPRSPSPPPLPPWAPLPPPNPDLHIEAKPLRLVGGYETDGVLQIYDEATDSWGALCVPLSEFSNRAANIYGPPDQDVAILACKQLGLPWRKAILTSPAYFPVAYSRFKTMAFGFYEGSMCANARSIDSFFNCDGIGIATSILGTCMRVANLLHLNRNFVPAAVICRDDASPPPPQLPPPSPPSPDPYTILSFPTRIVDPKDDKPISADRAKLFGRLEVFLPFGPRNRKVWGTVCGQNMPQAFAQYACRNAGLPYKNAAFSAKNRHKPSADSASLKMPIVVAFAEGCMLDDEGLACVHFANFDDARQLARRYPIDIDLAALQKIRLALAFCDLESGVGHQADAHLTCTDNEPPPPAPPSPPPPLPPPSPPTRVQTVVDFGTVEYAENVYGTTFGVQAPNGTTVWGGFCGYNGDSGATAPDSAALNTMCSIITSGVRPLGFITLLSPDYPYPNVPTPEEQRAVPAVLSSLACARVAGGAKNLSYCESTVTEPLPQTPAYECLANPWALNALSCISAAYAYTPFQLNVRLAGGDNASIGRVEVMTTGRLREGYGYVCAPEFTLGHAQAVCRDIGLGWTEAALLPSDAVPYPEEGTPAAIEQLVCTPNYPRFWDKSVWAPLSFMRDCSHQWDGSAISTCRPDQQVVVSCAGEVATPYSPPPASLSPPPPMYGGYGYGGYSDSPPPPTYSPPPPTYSDPPPAPAR